MSAMSAEKPSLQSLGSMFIKEHIQERGLMDVVIVRKPLHTYQPLLSTREFIVSQQAPCHMHFSISISKEYQYLGNLYWLL